MLEQTAEQAVRRAHALERQLDESDELARKKVELVRSELGYELSKMSSRMKELMRSHADSIEGLKKQHEKSARRSAVAVQTLTIDVASQTELVAHDLDNVDLLRKRYLDTITQMKSLYHITLFSLCSALLSNSNSLFCCCCCWLN